MPATMQEPGPNHRITIEPAAKQMRVRVQDHVIAASDRALVLKEGSLPPVVYFPRADVESAFFSKTAHTTHCSFKGDASYYSLFINGALAENVAWSYETPYPAAEPIRGMLAFYPNQVEVYALDEADAADHRRPEFTQSWPEPNTGI